MLNFCPYDFNEYDPENLAYELVFADGWDWDRVKKETSVGFAEEWKYLVNDNDTRRNKHYGYRENERHIVLQEARWKGQKNGLIRFIEMITYNNARLDALMTMYERMEKTSEKLPDSNPLTASAEAGMENLDNSTEALEYSPEEAASFLRIYHRKIDGQDVFIEEDGDWVMIAQPCCPHCHAPLPIGWKESEAYLPVGIFGCKGSGATSLFLSNYHENWSILKKYYWDSPIRVSQASVMETGLYDSTEYQAKAMCRSQGSAPESTKADLWACPAFFNIHYKNIRMTVGLYDFSAELMQHPNPLRNNQIRIWKHMKDICFLFDYLYSYHDLARNPYGCLAEYELFAGEVQSRFMDFSNMRVHGVLTKGDMLLGLKDKYPFNFKPFPSGQVSDEIMKARSHEVELMLSNEKILDKQTIEEFTLFLESLCDLTSSTDRGEEKFPLYWHLVSALGCDTDKNRTLNGEYQPLNPQDPVLCAVVMELKKLENLPQNE